MTSTEATLAIDRRLEALAAPPRSVRSIRYRGDDRAVRLSSMTPRDRDGVRALYAALSALDASLRANADDAASHVDVESVVGLARSLGRGDEAAGEDLRRALHDVRGGALTSLVVELQRVRLRRTDDGVKALRILTSDHLKVMRNAVLELDDARRDADLAPCPHSIGRLVESLARTTGEGARGAVRVEVRCAFSGAITMSCVELGALDRAALNLLNNAVRHADGEAVSVALLPVDAARGADLRMLVANPVAGADARALEGRFGADLARLFVDPFSTTGSGEGLKICVDFVAAAYGLARPSDAVRAGLVGAAMDGGFFLAWLHWPAVA